MKRLRIEHRTGFSYPNEVTASYNEARMLPVTGEGQFVLLASLDIEPHTAVAAYVDYFGTQVSSFDVLTAHDQLAITARSLVEVRARGFAPVVTTWDAQSDAVERSVEVAEQRYQTDLTRPHRAVARLAAEIAEAHANPDEAALEILHAVGSAMEYMPGVTTVRTTAAEAWEAGKGVCQDIAHVALGALRSVGIPARYVSGYLHPQREPALGESVTGESHAWIEWFVAAPDEPDEREEAGEAEPAEREVGRWQAFDPTNEIHIGDRHVMVARGRDYGDVPPLRGVYSGPTSSELHVTVTITREA